MTSLFAAVFTAQTYPSLSVHRQRYDIRGRRTAVALTTGNTQPLRLHVDFASLYEENAPEYSQCWRQGAWYKRGTPQATAPPASGVPSCRAEGPLDDCWGLCSADDLITPKGREMLIAVVTTIVNEEVSRFFAVRPVVGRLTFKAGRSRYAKALRAVGQSVDATSCAADCSALSSVAVAPSYCSTGVAADAVLSVVKLPSSGRPGVAGTGSSCAHDQNGRPLWLVFALLKPINRLESRSLAENVASLRSVVLHEIIHGLGFSHSFFNYARDSEGRRRHLIALSRVYDADGEEDEVWHFVRGRAYELAAAYFACSGVNASWQGLPLMGKPDMGRASHWETRIMRDDVMSYGHQGAVSSITLAALEDLGFYVANYSAAHCMSWGYQQGCEYVRSRCSAASDPRPRTRTVVRGSDCRGDPRWGLTADQALARKCVGGNDPCAATMPAFQCDPQCLADNLRDDCIAGPEAPVELASLEQTIEQMMSMASTDWQYWLLAWLVVTAALSILSSVRRCFCPSSPSAARRYSLVMAGMACVLSTAALATAAALHKRNSMLIRNTLASDAAELFDLHVQLLRDTIPAPLLRPGMLDALVGCSSVALCVSVVAVIAVLWYQRCVLRCLSWALLLLVLLEACLVLLLLYWVYSLDGLTNDSVETFLGSGLAEVQRFGEASGLEEVLDAIADTISASVSVLEGYMCVSYTTCCRGTADRTCVRRDASTDAGHVVAGDMQDPSAPLFCSYVTGADHDLLLAGAPSEETCVLLSTALGDSFSLPACRAAFCTEGVDGYVAFLRRIVAWLQHNAALVAILCGSMMIVQLTLAVNLCNVRKEDRRRVIGRDHWRDVRRQEPRWRELDGVELARGRRHNDRGPPPRHVDRGSPPRYDSRGRYDRRAPPPRYTHEQSGSWGY